MGTRLPPPLAYTALASLGDRPHVMVDGAARPGTVLSLSHWPGTPTPADLDGDTSTEIALAYLAAGQHHRVAAEAATCDHLDEDGATALFCVTSPELAASHARRLVAAATTGDFDVVTERDGARVAWALGHLFDPTRSPLRAPRAQWLGHALASALAELPALLAAPDRFESWWRAGDDAYARGVAALDAGEVVIERDGALGLALVTGPPPPVRDAFTAAGRAVLPLSRAALHSAIGEARVLVVAGDEIAYYDRYETWVRFRSRTLPARRDLAPLALRLGAEEPGGVHWRADPPGTTTPVLAPLAGARSGLDPERVRQLLVEYLKSAPAAWSADGPAGVSAPAVPTGGTSGRGRARWRDRFRAAPST